MCSARSSLNIFQDKLDGLKAKGRYRSLALPRGVDLTSNDYLGLADSDALREAAIAYLQNGGDIGAGGSRLLRGHCAEHAALEAYAAKFFAAPKTLYFSSGFQANATLFQTLCGRHDTIIFDEFVHASAREGIQNSNAQHLKVQHNDVNAFEDACKRAKGRIWIAVESVYSMDGDIAPLDDLYTLAEKYDAMLVIDEAHGSGVMGAKGKGLAYDLYSSSLRAKRSNPSSVLTDSAGDGLPRRCAPRNDGFPDNLITLHTCGKAMGVAGGLMCASSDVIEMMVNAARGFIYSTAPMPLQAHLVKKALEIVGSDDGGARRERLLALAKKAQQLFEGEGTHIVPIVIGDDDSCVHIAQMLQERGWDIRAIRPPTVPEGTARLRLSLSANLDAELLMNFAEDYETILNTK